MFGQLSPNTVTVTVSHGSDAQPDQAVFSVVVDSGIDRSLDDIVRALAGSGITGANLSGINFQSTQASAPIVWTFQWTAPLADVKAAIASLTSLQKSIPQNNSGLSLSFQLQYAQPSAQQFQNCDLGGLIADANSQAQKIAGAAGLNSTVIVGLDQTVSQPASACALTAMFALGYSGHPGPHTITITASRNASLPPPDQVVIVVSVNSGLSAGLDEISSAIAGAGISGAAFSSVSTVTQYNRFSQTQSLEWYFTLATPLAKLKETLAQLGTAQLAISKQNPTLTLAFSLQGIQASPQSQPSCPQGDLISDATAQAQRVAAAAGVSAGPILSISNGTASSSAVIFDPSTSFGYASFFLGLFSASATTACSLSVQFQLF